MPELGGVRVAKLSRSTPCAPQLQTAQPSVTSTVDPGLLAVNNSLAALPVSGLPPRTVVDWSAIHTPAEYLADSIATDQVARAAVMDKDGFRGGNTVDYESGMSDYGAIVLRFSSPTAALDELKVHVSALCEQATDITALSGATGISYARQDGLAKAVFVVGDAEVQLDVCSCVPVGDRVALAAAWANAVSAQLRSPDPTRYRP